MEKGNMDDIEYKADTKEFTTSVMLNSDVLYNLAHIPAEKALLKDWSVKPGGNRDGYDYMI